MSRIKERLKQYKDKYSKYSKTDGLYVSDVLEMIEQLQDDLKRGEKENGWIPVAERLPEEHDSVFAKYKGTLDWGVGMYMKTSAHVLVTVRYGDRASLVKQAHTTDGEWKIESSVLGGEVIAWMPFPAPYNDGKLGHCRYFCLKPKKGKSCCMYCGEADFCKDKCEDMNEYQYAGECPDYIEKEE